MTSTTGSGFCNDCALLVALDGKVTLCGPCANRVVQDQRRQLKIYRERVDLTTEALDILGSALAGHDHQWTPQERSAYEKAIRGVK